ncbi:radical SAM protein [Candidatus Woesearchaeota archaeon]|nr:radical SAM protein [Candidatus Woesearchaeota archaeon]
MYKPKKLSLIITSVCNAKCKYCLYEKKREHLPLEDIKKIVTEAKEIGIECVTITGGEPSLHPQFFEILDYITSQGLSIGLISNGFQMNKEKVKKILDYGIVYPWTSIDSHDEEINDKSRGKNAYKYSIEFIKMIREIKPEQYIGVISIITQYNINSYEKTADFLVNELKFNMLRVDRPVIINQAEKNNISNEHITKKYLELCKELVKKNEDIIKPVMFSHGHECPIFNKNYFEVNVFPDGNIIPCCFMHDPKFSMGTVKDKLSKTLNDKNVDRYKNIINTFFRNRSSKIGEKGIFGCVECVEEYKKLRNSGKLDKLIQKKSIKNIVVDFFKGKK